jgi:hypothetical protein
MDMPVYESALEYDVTGGVQLSLKEVLLQMCSVEIDPVYTALRLQ